MPSPVSKDDSKTTSSVDLKQNRPVHAPLADFHNLEQVRLLYKYLVIQY